MKKKKIAISYGKKRAINEAFMQTFIVLMNESIFFYCYIKIGKKQ
jgi:hypothetical protein